MTQIKKKTISTLVILFLLTLAVTAQQPQPAAPVKVTPAPATTPATTPPTAVVVPQVAAPQQPAAPTVRTAATPQTPVPTVSTTTITPTALTTVAPVIAPASGSVTLVPTQPAPAIATQSVTSARPTTATPVATTTAATVQSVGAPTVNVTTPTAMAPVASTNLTPVVSATTVAPITSSTAPTLASPRAQSESGQAVQTTTGTQAPVAESDSITVRFNTKIIEVKNASPSALALTLRALGSGFKGSRIDPSEERKLLIVRDFPENIATIEEAVKRLDVPTPPKADIEVTLRVLLASNVDGASTDVSADLRDVVKQLQSTFNYKTYSLVSSVVQRIKDANSLQGSGTFQVGTPLIKEPTDVPYYFGIDRLEMTSAGAAAQLNIRRFRYSLNPQSMSAINERVGKADVASDFSMREGEKVVVGTASLKDKALILVISARVIK